MKFSQRENFKYCPMPLKLNCSQHAKLGKNIFLTCHCHWITATDWIFHTGSGLPCLIQLLTCLHVSEYQIFETLKSISLKTNSLPLNDCFRYRNFLQNGVKNLSKFVLKNQFETIKGYFLLIKTFASLL